MFASMSPFKKAKPKEELEAGEEKAGSGDGAKAGGDKVSDAPKHIVSFKVGLPDMTMDAFDDEMQTSFKADVATKLNVEPDDVDIEASAGSVNVDVKVSVVGGTYDNSNTDFMRNLEET